MLNGRWAGVWSCAEQILANYLQPPFTILKLFILLSYVLWSNFDLKFYLSLSKIGEKWENWMLGNGCFKCHLLVEIIIFRVSTFIHSLFYWRSFIVSSQTNVLYGCFVWTANLEMGPRFAYVWCRGSSAEVSKVHKSQGTSSIWMPDMQFI